MLGSPSTKGQREVRGRPGARLSFAPQLTVNQAPIPTSRFTSDDHEGGLEAPAEGNAGKEKPASLFPPPNGVKRPSAEHAPPPFPRPLHDQAAGKAREPLPRPARLGLEKAKRSEGCSLETGLLPRLRSALGLVSCGPQGPNRPGAYLLSSRGEEATGGLGLLSLEGRLAFRPGLSRLVVGLAGPSLAPRSWLCSDPTPFSLLSSPLSLALCSSFRLLFPSQPGGGY